MSSSSLPLLPRIDSMPCVATAMVAEDQYRRRVNRRCYCAPLAKPSAPPHSWSHIEAARALGASAACPWLRSTSSPSPCVHCSRLRVCPLVRGLASPPVPTGTAAAASVKLLLPLDSAPPPRASPITARLRPPAPLPPLAGRLPRACAYARAAPCLLLLLLCACPPLLPLTLSC